MSKRTFSPTRVVAGAVAVAGILAGTYAWMTRSADDPPAAIMWDSVAPPDAGRHTTGQDLAGVRAALARRRSDVGTDDPGVAELAVRLGDLCRVAGRFDEARSSYAEAAAIRERVAGGGHWQARECRAKIAHLAADPAGAARGYARRAEAERLLAEGKYSAAHAAAAEALDFTRAARGPDHADAAEALLLLGAISLHHDENYAAAEGLLSEAKAKLAVARGTDHPYFGDCLHLLGVLADARGDFASAEEFYTGAMRVHTAARGEMTAEYARSLSRYGRMCQAWWKEYADGKVYRAQTIREEVLGRAHPDYAESLEDLARFALAAPDVVKADRLLTEALAIRRNAQGPDHPDVAETLSLIGVARDAQGDLAQSQASHRRAVRSAEAARGPRHPLVARYLLNHMTSLAGRMTEFARIDQYGRRALDIWANLALDRHPDTLETRFQIARTRVIEMSKLTKTADYPVADLDANFQELLDGYDRLPGGRDLPGYALAMSERVHMCYYDDFRLHPRAEAEKWLVRAGEVIDRNGGRTHPAYLYYLNAYGRLHLSAGEYDQAGRYFRDCLALVRSRYGSANPWITMYALHSYGGMYLHQGDRDAARRFTREALLVRREMFDRNSHGQSDAERISQVVDMHYTLSGYLSAFVTAGTAADCYDDVLRIRGAAAAQQVEDRAAHDAPDLRGRLEEAQAARRGLAELALSGSDGTPGRLARPPGPGGRGHVGPGNRPGS